MVTLAHGVGGPASRSPHHRENQPNVQPTYIPKIEKPTTRAKFWHPTPNDWPPQWLTVPFRYRAIALAIYHLGKGYPVPCPENWRLALCKMPMIDGKERAAFQQTLLTMLEKGLLSTENGEVSVDLPRPEMRKRRTRPILVAIVPTQGVI